MSCACYNKPGLHCWVLISGFHRLGMSWGLVPHQGSLLTRCRLCPQQAWRTHKWDLSTLPSSWSIHWVWISTSQKRKHIPEWTLNCCQDEILIVSLCRLRLTTLTIDQVSTHLIPMSHTTLVHAQTLNTKTENHPPFTFTTNTLINNIDNTFPHYNHWHPIGQPTVASTHHPQDNR